MHPILVLNSALLDYSPQSFAGILESLVFAIEFYCVRYLVVNPAKVGKVGGPGLEIRFDKDSQLDISASSIVIKRY